MVEEFGLVREMRALPRIRFSVSDVGWDHHIANFKMLRKALPPYDGKRFAYIFFLRSRLVGFARGAGRIVEA